VLFTPLNLEKSVGGEKDVQDIDLDSVMKKCVVTLLVMSTFFIPLGESRARLRAPAFGVQTFVIQLIFLG